MLTITRILVGLSIVWAAVALAVQVITARGDGRRDFSRPSGNPWRGMLYNFTVAMSPWHKETARRHPLEFVLGVVLHVGTLSSIVGLILLVTWPSAGWRWLVLVRPAVLAALLAGIWLFIRRICSKTLHAISVPDDYLAILATCGLLALAAAAPIGLPGQLALLAYGGLLFLYLPLGKLRHAVFFFVARGDYSWRLGRRGVYPPAKASVE